MTGLARESDQEFVESRKARLVTELDGITYDAVLEAAARQLDDQAGDTPQSAFAGGVLGRWIVQPSPSS